MVADQSVPASAIQTLRKTLQPKLRLFLSADIVGSTAFKQRGEDDSSKWFDTVCRFYRLAESIFIRRWESPTQLTEVAQYKSTLFGEPPELWKTVGDEVLFTKTLTHPAQAMMCMRIWMDVLEELRDFLLKVDGRSLDVKSSAWIADFPYRNREVILRAQASASNQGDDPLDWTNDCLLQRYDEDKSGLSRDFIGPSIDTGFRLGSSASPRQLMLSVELAHLLSGEASKFDEPMYKSGPYRLPAFVYRFAGRQSLKGVLDGTPYPHIWIDTSPEKPIHRTEDVLAGRLSPQPSQIHAFTSAFIAEHPAKFCTDLTFDADKPPAEYEQYCDRMRDRLINLEKKFFDVEATRADRDRSDAILEGSPSHAELDIALQIKPLNEDHS
jgi:class 3 adenylate cyclase